MTVLVTGGAGFIGSYIVDLLIDNDYDVIIADNMSHGRQENINSKAKFYNIDITSPDLERVFKENHIKFVSHHAAQAAVNISTSDPLLDAKSNILGTLNLLELSKKYGVDKFIYASTAAVYGSPEYLPVDENHPAMPMSNYGLSKLTAEKYIQLSGLNYVIFRYSNVYGPRQNALGEAGVISIFMDRIKSGRTVEIHGDGEQTRDFLHAEDAARANLKAIQENIKNEILNISSNSSISISRLFDIIRDENTQVKYTSPREGDIKDSTLDNHKAEKFMGWHPEYDLVKGLEEFKVVNNA